MKIPKTFQQKLEAKWAKGKFLCVGLDPVMEKLPTHLSRKDTEESLYSFFKDIIDSTSSIVAAFKPNFAFFLEFGSIGVSAYERICEYIKDFHPRAILICDAKCGDIGKSNAGPATFFFNICRGDALTVQSYLSGEALQPFLDYTDKGVIILCKTSNPGSGEFQDKEVSVTSKEMHTIVERAGQDHNLGYHMPLYQYVAAHVNTLWNANKNCALVTGATYSAEIKKVREVAPNLTLLLPGFGKQGGKPEDVIPVAFAGSGGFIASWSSDVIYASSEKYFASAARAKAKELDKQIRAIVAELRLHR